MVVQVGDNQTEKQLSSGKQNTTKEVMVRVRKHNLARDPASLISAPAIVLPPWVSTHQCSDLYVLSSFLDFLPHNLRTAEIKRPSTLPSIYEPFWACSVASGTKLSLDTRQSF